MTDKYWTHRIDVKAQPIRVPEGKWTGRTVAPCKCGATRAVRRIGGKLGCVRCGLPREEAA